MEKSISCLTGHLIDTSQVHTSAVKTIGLLGGISWVSTQIYYEQLNLKTAEKFGAGRQPKVVLKSFDYQRFHDLQKDGRGAEVEDELAQSGHDLESIGAEILAICANTMHMYFDQVQAAVRIPVIHVADACGASIKSSGFQMATLLGTKYTMEGDFYRRRLMEKFGIDTLIPDERERDEVDGIIRTELTRNLILPESREIYLSIIERYSAVGAQCVILGCTEIGLLIKQCDTFHPVFDTTSIHVDALLNAANCSN